MNKNMTKFLILAIILCITVGVASATEASSDDATAKDAPTITKNTPTTEKIITKTENKKINKNNKTQTVKKDTGDLYVSPDVTEAKTGTNEDPTTIIDAVSKVTQNGNIILLPGTTGVYTPTEQIVISDDTTQADTNKFSFTADNTNIEVDASQVANLFQINTGYDVTFNNVSINNAIDHAIYVNGGNVTLNGEVTYNNCTTLANFGSTRGGVITGSGNVNIIGSNTFTNNKANEGGSVVALSNGNLTISGENTFINNNIRSTAKNIFGGIIYIDGVNLIINGSNKFINNTQYGRNCAGGVIYSLNSKNITITGENIFKNNTVNGTGTIRNGGAIFYRAPNPDSTFKIVGENIFEDNHAPDANGGAIYYEGHYNNNNNLIISGSNTFKGNSLEKTKSFYSNGGAIYATNFNNLIIEGSNKFINNQAGRYGGVLFTNPKQNSNISITGENLFENNTINITGKTLGGTAIYTSFVQGVTFKSIGSSYINNYLNGRGIINGVSIDSDVNIIISENKFINNTATNLCILDLGVNGDDENSRITITENTFIGNTAANETISLFNPCQTTIENNIYSNTTIGITEINLTSEMIGQEVEPNTPITLNYNATLTNPNGYDSDLPERLEYQVYINGENKYNGTGNIITINEDYSPETQGTLNIYVKIDKTTSNTITITQQKPKSKTNITTENPELGETTQLQATFYDEEGLPVNGGKAIFKVNGKTLRNDDGSVIYVDVTNGIAELPDVKITSEWMKPDTTIQAVYIGDNNNEPIITTPTNVTVTKPEATISLEVPKEAIVGQEITLKANVTDGVNAISSGRVAFKLNGKTLKNAEGKALYANVEKGMATITYTIPEKTKAKTYVLTAVFTDNTYQRSQKEESITIK